MKKSVLVLSLMLTILLTLSLLGSCTSPSSDEISEYNDEVFDDTINSSGVSIIVRGFETYEPNLVSLFLQIYKDGKPVSELSRDDFTIKDDDEELAFRESYKSIKKAGLLNYRFKTVVAVDVSGSIDFNDLDKIKEALRYLINNKEDYQEISIVAFSDKPNEIIDFTTDKQALLNAVERLKISPAGATNLYGAISYCLDKWDDTIPLP